MESLISRADLVDAAKSESIAVAVEKALIALRGDMGSSRQKLEIDESCANLKIFGEVLLPQYRRSQTDNWASALHQWIEDEIVRLFIEAPQGARQFEEELVHCSIAVAMNHSKLDGTIIDTPNLRELSLAERRKALRRLAPDLKEPAQRARETNELRELGRSLVRQARSIEQARRTRHRRAAALAVAIAAAIGAVVLTQARSRSDDPVVLSGVANVLVSEFESGDQSTGVQLAESVATELRSPASNAGDILVLPMPVDPLVNHELDGLSAQHGAKLTIGGSIGVERHVVELWVYLSGLSSAPEIEGVYQIGVVRSAADIGANDAARVDVARGIADRASEVVTLIHAIEEFEVGDEARALEMLESLDRDLFAPDRALGDLGELMLLYEANSAIRSPGGSAQAVDQFAAALDSYPESERLLLGHLFAQIRNTSHQCLDRGRASAEHERMLNVADRLEQAANDAVAVKATFASAQLTTCQALGEL